VEDPSRYPVPAGRARVEITVKRSRFVATAARVADTDAAHALVAEVRAEMPDATHHCWAFVAGPPGSTAQIGMSDDGEPHGTAGRPMLHALLHGGIGDVAVVCTRYFGGVKLGTGGLSRAYADAAKAVLASLATVEKVRRVPVEVTVGYADVEALRRLAAERGALVEGEEYGSDVRYRMAVPVSDVETFTQALADASQGRALVRRL